MRGNSRMSQNDNCNWQSTTCVGCALREQTSRGGWRCRLLILLASWFPMFVVSCEMRLALQLDSKFVATGTKGWRRACERIDAGRQEFRSCYKLSQKPQSSNPLLAESDHAENTRRRQPQQLYVENCSVMALQPLSQLRAVQLDPARQIEDLSRLRLNGSNFE